MALMLLEHFLKLSVVALIMPKIFCEQSFRVIKSLEDLHVCAVEEPSSKFIVRSFIQCAVICTNIHRETEKGRNCSAINVKVDNTSDRLLICETFENFTPVNFQPAAGCKCYQVSEKVFFIRLRAFLLVIRRPPEKDLLIKAKCSETNTKIYEQSYRMLLFLLASH